jgi:hypothetical protein
MSSLPVTVSSFTRAETHRMFNDLQAAGGGINEFFHVRTPTSIDAQPVIRMNRDTLYSIAIVDLAEGATVTIPDAKGRYLSVMIVDEDHHVTAVLHEPGVHVLDADELGSRYVGVVARILVDPAERNDVLLVRELQNQLAIDAGSAVPFVMPDYDDESFTKMRKAVLALGKGLDGLDGAFGTKDEVDPIMHLIGTAAGWGGLPMSEAVYVNVDPGLPVGSYRVHVRDVPADAFWSVSVYNKDGFFEKNDQDSYSVNDLTAITEPDGSVIIHFGDCGDGRPNCIPITEGWNAVVRLYRPRPAATDGSWSFPAIEPAI